MLQLPKADKKVLIILALMLCIAAGFGFERLYQPNKKTIKIYTQALHDYNKKDYSNSYYLFSRVGRYSKLKPPAIYRQALCAKSLGDTKSELEAYHSLFKNFPTNQLAIESKYRYAQLLIDKNSHKARQYFNEIIYSNANDEYKIASEYFKSAIDSKDYKNNPSKYSIFQIEKGFREYLKKYPDGKYALEVSKNWQGFNPDISSADNTLIARTYNIFNDYKSANAVLQKTNIQDSWAVTGVNLFKLGENDKAIELIKTGISKYSDFVDRFDYNKAVDLYIQNNQDYKEASSELFNLATGSKKDYVWSQKCKFSPKPEKYRCYQNLYASLPNSDYAQDAMMNTLIGFIVTKDYSSAKSVAEDFMFKYPNSEYLPMIMFWRAKIEQIYSHNPNFEIFYKNIINNFPDTYYAYRSFWIINNFKSAVINSNINDKPIVYPYKYPSKGKVLYYLLLVEDYDLINKYTDDGFIKSWADYKRGNYMTSLHKAKKAMEELKAKPPKDDVRWRLVYPLNYLGQVEKNSYTFGNDTGLILSLIKEESYFNSNAQSGAGALGLMQLMPETAQDTGGYQFSINDLLNPELNIKIGNMYYENLRNSLNNNDTLAVAAYNGGIGSVKKWLEILDYSDLDEFVEQIPYSETKNYVKKVFRSYWNYIRVYND